MFEHHINAIETWIAGLGSWGVIAFVGLFIFAASILLPDTLLCIIAGALFPLGWGIVAVVAGSLLAGSLQFALARRLLRVWIQRALAAKPALAAIQRAVRRDELRLQTLLRLTPLNPAILSYVLGAAGVGFPGFLLACLALAPALITEVYFGYASKHVARMAGRDAPMVYLHDCAIIGGLAVCVIVMFIVTRIARNAVLQAVAETANVDAGDNTQRTSV